MHCLWLAVCYNLENMKLLIIEDDPILLKMYESKFQTGNYKIISATDGQQGIEKAINYKPDFIILDLRLPKVDGIEVLNKLKKIPIIKDIPVAALTVVQEDIALKADPDLMSKIVAYLRKDLNTPNEVFKKVEEYLNSHA